MKIIMAAEVLLNGLDPTKPHRTLDPYGRLAAPPKKEEPSAVFPFLPTPSIEKEMVEQSVMVEPSHLEMNSAVETAPSVEPSSEPTVLEIGGDSMKDYAVNVNVSIKLDEAQLPELTRPRGRPKGSSSKKTA